VAAALAYGFQSQSDKVFWLVYDFGGGTFDAAVIRVRDGLIEVVNHEGDNTVGGKDVDWEIVEQILAPALTKECKLTNFKRGNRKWRSAFAKLKYHAEEAKIALSRRQSFEIDIKFSTEEGFPDPFQFYYTIQQSDVAAIAEPSIIKTINICKKALVDKRLEGGNIEKVLLVGGPTLAPYLRERLSDKVDGLGIPLESNVDPMTVVARGAAIFAGSQRMPSRPPVHPSEQVENGPFMVTFPDWKFIGIDEEPIVAGKVEPPAGERPEGLSIEFVNEKAKPAWRSGKLALTEGRFMTTLWAVNKSTNTYLVELIDGTGRLIKAVTDPHPLTYTVGLNITDPILTHSLGVALINNEFFLFLEKGTPLSAHKRVVLHTSRDVRRGQAGDLIRIMVMEGGSPRADRNRRVATLEIPSDQVKRDIPAGSEIEVTIDINQSRIMETKALIPILNEEFENVIPYNPEDNKFDPKVFGQELEKEKERLATLREKSKATGDEQALEALQRIEQEQMVQQADAAFAAASDDADDAKKCQNRLLDLRKAVDAMEDALEWPALVLDAENLISAGKEIAQQKGNTDERRIVQAEEAQLRIALKSHDPELLKHQIESYRLAIIRILQRTGEFQVAIFQDLCDHMDEMRDQNQAQRLKSEGLRALNANDKEGLEAINRQMAGLLPAPLPQRGWEPKR
jgi:molecular chaperone DnaK